MRAWRIALVLSAIAALGLASCRKADTRKPTYPVSGRILFAGGKPVEHATVILHPVGETGEEVVKPRGKVAADGTFTLTTYDGHDGAPAGDYRVTVELWLATGKSDEAPTSRLPARYARPETSGLTAKIESGPTELRPIELKR